MGVAMRAAILFILLAGCAGQSVKPEPRIIYQRVEVPVATACVATSDIPAVTGQLQQPAPQTSDGAFAALLRHIANLRAEAAGMRATLEGCAASPETR